MLKLIGLAVVIDGNMLASVVPDIIWIFYQRMKFKLIDI